MTSPAVADAAGTPTWFTAALAAAAEDRAITVEGTSIAYRAWGDPADRTIALVHGGAAHSRWWDHIAPLLAVAARCSPTGTTRYRTASGPARRAPGGRQGGRPGPFGINEPNGPGWEPPSGRDAALEQTVQGRGGVQRVRDRAPAGTGQAGQVRGLLMVVVRSQDD